MCVGSERGKGGGGYNGAAPQPLAPLCDIQSICGSSMGPWTVTRLFFTA